MSFSDNDIPYIVFTNSRNDYRVTVESGYPGDEAKKLVDQIARKSAHIFDGSMHTLVTLVPLDEGRHDLFAARVFDVGTYAGRPHTLGIVAVTIPSKEDRNWSLGALLEQFPHPKPDSDSYSFPALNELSGKSAESDFFADIDNWDEQHAHSLLESPSVFSDPPGISLDLGDYMLVKEKKNKKLVFVLLAAIVIGVFIGCCTNTEMTSTIGNWFSPEQEKTDDLETQDILSISSEERRGIVDLLFGYDFERPAYIPEELNDIRDMSDEEFSVFIADIAEAMCGRIEELKKTLSNQLEEAVKTREHGTLRRVENDLGGVQEQWKEAFEWNEGERYKYVKNINNVVDIVRLYNDIEETIGRVIKHLEEAETDDAMREISNLMEQLNRIKDICPDHVLNEH